MTATSMSDRFKSIFKSDAKESIRECLMFDQIERHLFFPLVISNCNGTGPWPFNDATVEYTISHETAFPSLFYYMDVFMEVAEGKSGFEEQKKYAIECLLDTALYKDYKHIQCLRSLFTEKTSEAKVKTILAIHYFQPLVPHSCYVIDRGSLSTCEKCKEKIKYGDTSFGHKLVWHGVADIFLHKSVVKVSTEGYNDCENDSDDTVDISCASPAKQRRTSSSESEEDNLTSIEEDIVQKTKKKKLQSIAIAQCIVNAFCVTKRDQTLYDRFIPSFLATEKYIRIILYNCSSDILLLGEKLPIWKDTELDTRTLLQVWLFLNFETIEVLAPDFIYEDMPSSKFRDVVHDVYSIYTEKATRPLEPLDKVSKRSFPYAELNMEKHKKIQIFLISHYSKVDKL